MAETPKSWNDPEYNPTLHGMVFKPAPDITAWERARILQRAASLKVTVTPQRVSGWPRELQRHWRSIK